MLRSPSSIRSLLHLSGRRLCPRSPRFLGSPNPPLPCSARSPPRPRFLSSSSLPTHGGARWATNDHDALINSLCASASDTPANSDVWAVFDPVAGRIVIQSPPSSSCTEEEEEEQGEGAGKREGEEKAGAKEEGKSKRKGEGVRERREEPDQTVAGLGGTEARGEGQQGECHVPPGPILEIREMVPQCDGGSSEEGMEEGGGEGERDDEEKAGVKEQGKGKRKGRACSSSEKGQTSQSSVAAAWKPAGKGGKERVLYVCINCREGHLQWWGTCRYYNASRTIQKIREMVPQCDGGPSEKEVEEGEGAGERDDEEKAGVKEEEKNGEGKGKWKRKGRASAAGKKGQSSPPLVAVAQKSVGKGGKVRAWYVCSHCGEGYPRWWGCCRHCHAVGTLEKSREMVPPSFQEVD
ncbi:unnamed protein product [Urochloa decumbens]|uniref:Uncharacterized protein n=1 Tax=Urochloa decumbens TaxID=240449 RepID=A0ABC9CXK2_9POAL